MTDRGEGRELFSLYEAIGGKSRTATPSGKYVDDQNGHVRLIDHGLKAAECVLQEILWIIQREARGLRIVREKHVQLPYHLRSEFIATPVMTRPISQVHHQISEVGALIHDQRSEGVVPFLLPAVVLEDVLVRRQTREGVGLELIAQVLGRMPWSMTANP